MKILCCFFLFFFCVNIGKAQDINGKWYGYALQDTGELCETCSFELNLTRTRDVSGDSYTYVDQKVNIRFNLYGYIDKQDTIRLQEEKDLLIEGMTPPKWDVCVKQYFLKYSKINNSEFLLGRGTGQDIKDGSDCLPALLIFARTKEEAAAYLTLHKDSLLEIIIPPKKGLIHVNAMAEYPPAFNHTTTNKLTEIQVEHTDLEVQIRDYLRIDNDTISVYLNRKLILGQKRISSKPISFKFSITKNTLNELLIYAENLGEVPPNTSEMYVIDGKKSYRIMIESDKQKTAAVYLRYQPRQ